MEPATLSPFGELIEGRMRLLGKSRAEVVDELAILGLEVHPQTLGSWLRGDRVPRVSHLVVLLDCLQVAGLDRAYALDLLGDAAL